MLILTDEDHYKLAVNGFHYAEFEHRMPGGRVSHLNIEGDVKVTLICYEGTMSRIFNPLVVQYAKKKNPLEWRRC